MAGQRAHRFEVRTNRYITSETHVHSATTEIDEDDKNFYIKPLSEDAAFYKGVEWGSDVFFFYSIILFFAMYDIYLMHQKEEKAKQQSLEF